MPTIGIREERDSGLLPEKCMTVTYMTDLELQLLNESNNFKQKNAKDSIQYRTLGNKLYGSKSHDVNTHHKIWNLYSQSIVTAPNDSEELAVAYGNRSALLFHLKKYEDCIKDCDQVLKLTVATDFLKARILFRKFECIFNLEKTAVGICEEAIELFKRFDLNNDVKEKFIEKIKGIFNNTSVTDFELNKKEPGEKLQEFIRKYEIPCASTAITIDHNQKWGRHIVATRKIEPGEILVLEKSSVTMIEPDKMYLFCSHCNKQTWSSIPCNTCMYAMYCTGKCKFDAWTTYHQFECPVLCYLYSIDIGQYPFVSGHDTKEGKTIMRDLRLALKFLLLSKAEMVNLKRIENKFLEILYCHDNHTKGFSTDGIFHSEKCQSFYSLSTTSCDRSEDAKSSEAMIISCVALYYLARETNFFYKKINLPPSEMADIEIIILAGALLMKTMFLIQINSFDMNYYLSGNDSPLDGGTYGLSLNTFCSLFNHSCNPNVKSIFTKKRERIIYATHVIEEGQQLFLSYVGDDYTSHSKTDRRKILKYTYFFDCKCAACKENWPRVLKSVEDKLKESHQSKSMEKKFRKIQNSKKKLILSLTNNNFEYDPNTVEDLKNLMIEHQENFTARNTDYQEYKQLLHKMLIKGFGVLLNIPENC